MFRNPIGIHPGGGFPSTGETDLHGSDYDIISTQEEANGSTERDSSTFVPWEHSRYPRGRYAGLASTHITKSSSLGNAESIEVSPEDMYKADAAQKRNYMQSASWLHPFSLAAFAALLLLLVAAVITISELAQRDDGFGLNSSISPYAYKYGPTAILALVVALWRPVDYRLKITAPWLQLRTAPSAAHKSVLLDYLSPIWPIAFVQSLRNRHWRVSIGVVILQILQLTILVSTALMIPHTTTLSQLETGVNLDNSVHSSIPAEHDDDLVLLYFGMLVKGLVPRPRTTLTSAYQDIKFGESPPNGTVITADVLGFFPSLNCETATTTHEIIGATDGGKNMTSASTEFTFDAPSCNVPSMGLNGLCDLGQTSGVKCEPQQLLTSTTVVDCPDPHDASLSINALLILLMEYSNTKTTQTYGKTTALICYAGYSIEQARLTTDFTNRNANGFKFLSGPLTETGQQLPSYNTSDLMNAVASLSTAANVDLPPAPLIATIGGQIPSIENAFINLMLYAGQISNVTELFNASISKSLGQRVFQGLASQWVGATQPLGSDLTTNATYISRSLRLYVSESSLSALCILLGIAALLVVVLAFSLRRACNRPDTLPFQLSILRQSPEFEELLESLAKSSRTQLSAQLAGDFSTTGKTIHVDKSSVHVNDNPALQAERRFWRPMPFRVVFAVLAVVVPLLIIALLEVLQYLSDSNDGLADVSISSSAAQEIATYMAAAVMLAIAGCSSSAEFNFAVLAPYHAMRHRAVPVRHARSTLGSFPPVSLVQSLVRRQWALSAAMTSAILGAILTIITSGLYTIDAVPAFLSTNLTTTDRFNVSWDGEGGNSGATMFSLVDAFNASYPSGTHSEIAYNMLAPGPGPAGPMEKYASSQIQVQMPVMRASLNCTLVPKSAIRVNVTNKYVAPASDGLPEVYPGWVANVTVAVDLPQACRASNPKYRHASQLLVTSVVESVASSGFTNDGVMSTPQTRIPSQHGLVALSGPDCPSLAFQLGRYQAGQTSNANTTVFMCTQYQESVVANMTFNLPSFELNTTRPIIIDESTAAVVGRVQYNLINLFRLRLGVINQPLGAFMSSVVQGIDGVPADELIGEANTERLQNAIQHVYRMFMAQAISASARLPANVTTTTKRSLPALGAPQPAQLYESSQLRLVQHAASKTVLQAVLGAMVLCFVAGSWFMRAVRRLLYHNPCSIVGSMSLLAGSSLVREYVTEADKGHGPMGATPPGIESQSHVKLRLGSWTYGDGGSEKRWGIDAI